MKYFTLEVSFKSGLKIYPKFARKKEIFLQRNTSVNKNAWPALWKVGV